MNDIRNIEALVALAILANAALVSGAAAADSGPRRSDTFFSPGKLVVSRSVYDNKPSNVSVGTILPPNRAATTGGCSASTG